MTKYYLSVPFTVSGYETFIVEARDEDEAYELLQDINLSDLGGTPEIDWSEQEYDPDEAYIYHEEKVNGSTRTKR